MAAPDAAVRSLPRPEPPFGGVIAELATESTPARPEIVPAGMGPRTSWS